MRPFCLLITPQSIRLTAYCQLPVNGSLLARYKLCVQCQKAPPLAGELAA